MATSNIFRWQPLSVPSDFDGLPSPRVTGYPRFFFHQNDPKGCEKDYSDARGHFVWRFGAIDETVRGW